LRNNGRWDSLACQPAAFAVSAHLIDQVALTSMLRRSKTGSNENGITPAIFFISRPPRWTVSYAAQKSRALSLVFD
jgi:hypothetical protein